VIPSPKTVAVQAYCVMCAWRVNQMAFFKRKEMLSIFQRKHETYLFQLVMDEIANTWGEMVRLRRVPFHMYAT
jgi:hypothetical protein